MIHSSAASAENRLPVLSEISKQIWTFESGFPKEAAFETVRNSLSAIRQVDSKDRRERKAACFYLRCGKTKPGSLPQSTPLTAPSSEGAKETLTVSGKYGTISPPVRFAAGCTTLVRGGQGGLFLYAEKRLPEGSRFCYENQSSFALASAMILAWLPLGTSS